MVSPVQTQLELPPTTPNENGGSKRRGCGRRGGRRIDDRRCRGPRRRGARQFHHDRPGGIAPRDATGAPRLEFSTKRGQGLDEGPRLLDLGDRGRGVEPLARTSQAAAVAAERDTPAAPCTRTRPPDAGASSTKVVVAGHAARRFVRVLFSARTWR